MLALIEFANHNAAINLFYFYRVDKDASLTGVMRNSLLVANIFRHFSYCDLIRVARVNRQFLHVTRRYEQQRRAITHIMDDHLFEDGAGMEEANWQHIENQVQCRPDVCIFFYASILAGHPHLPYWDLIPMALPPNCVTLSVFNDTTVVGTEPGHQIEQINVQEIEAGVLSSMFIPTKGCSYQIESFTTSRKLFSLVTRPKNKKVKCILVFAGNNNQEQFMRRLLEQRPLNFALGGAIVHKVSLGCGQYYPTGRDQYDPKRKSKFAGLVFSGEGVRAASIVSQQMLCQGIKIDLERLKQSLDFDVNDSTCQTFGFMFTCVSRSDAQSKEDEETNAFKTVFPTVPLMGIHAYGEFGHDYLPNQSDKLVAGTNVTIEQQFTVVYVLLQLTLKN